MCNCHSILESCVMFSGVKLSIRSFNLFMSNFRGFSVNVFVAQSCFKITIKQQNKN